MAYTATKTLQPRAFPFPAGFDNTQKMAWLRGTMVENDTATEYSIGGIGSSAFQVTAFSAVGLVTYNSLVGLPLVNGQLVVIYNTSSNTNDGTYTVSQLTPSSSVAGTFVAVPLAGKTLAGSAQTTQTAEGVGQIQFGSRQYLNQTFTVTAVTVSGGVMTCTYTTLVGPQLQPGDSVLLAGMTNAGNNGSFSLVAVYPTSSTAGSFTVTNTAAVASDSGTGTGKFKTGSDFYDTLYAPVQVELFNSKGYLYKWNPTNQTVQIFMTGASSGAVLAEAALGATVAFDGGITFETIFQRSKF
jgi:hypothetical protein